MGIVQLRFETPFEPVSLVNAWWSEMGVADGLPMPDPMATVEGTTCGGYRDDLWVNLELWQKPDSSTTVARLSARSEPFGDQQVRAVLQDLAKELQPSPSRVATAALFEPDSFTWVGDWDWTVDGPDETGLSMAQIDALRATTPRGLCGADGTLLADASQGCIWAIVDSPRNVAYLGYQYLHHEGGEHFLTIADGRSPVPLSSVQGVSVVTRNGESYAAALSPDGGTLALVEYNGAMGYGHSYVTLVDTRTGGARRLTWFIQASGGERLSFSPDGRWLLIERTSNDAGPIIVDLNDGSQREFASILHAPCWWVNDGHLGLLELGHGASKDSDFDPTRVTFHDLTTGEAIAFPPLRFPDFGLDRSWLLVFHAAPHADGRVLLEHFGPPPNENYQVSFRLASVDVATGQFTSVVEPFADPDKFIRRKQDRWSWNSPLALEVGAPASVLVSGFQKVDTSLWPEPEEEQRSAVLRVDLGSPFFTRSL